MKDLKFRKLSREQLQRISGGVKKEIQVCGIQNGNILCTAPECCSVYGYCGTGTFYCGFGSADLCGCQSGPCFLC